MEKYKVIKNESNKNIVNYPIAEAEIDRNTGDAIFDTGTGLYKETGNTYTWSLRAGETLEFPAYVADYLMSVYDFISEVDAVVKKEEKKAEVVEPRAEKVKEKPEEYVEETKKKEELPEGTCPICGDYFDSDRGLVMHMASKHAEEIKEKF